MTSRLAATNKAIHDATEENKRDNSAIQIHLLAEIARTLAILADTQEATRLDMLKQR
jgi:hypothetical protein